MIQARYGDHAVRFDGEFRFIPASNEPEIQNPVECRVGGAAFLSGSTEGFVAHVSRNGDCRCFYVHGALIEETDKDITHLTESDRVILCGPVVSDPLAVADWCGRIKARALSVCPLDGPLAAFGYVAGAAMLTGKARPIATRFCQLTRTKLPGTAIEYNKDMEGDGFGRMAHLVQTDQVVLNQIMTTPCIGGFYGRVLAAHRWWGEPVFLMLARTALEFFPCEPLSLRNYAATWLPVSVANTKEFATISGYGRSRVKIFVASELTPGLGSFLRFVHVMSGIELVASSSPDQIPAQAMPVFRGDRAYSVGETGFQEAMHDAG